MILPRLTYRKAADIEEAVRLYQDCSGKAEYLSGGTDLVPRLKLRLLQPGTLIDLKGIESLTLVDEEDGWIRMGALALLSDLLENPLVVDHVPALSDSLKATSCLTLQMRGTIGGNLLQNTRCLFYNQSEFWRKSKGFCLKTGGDQCNAVPGAKVCLANYCSDNATALLTVAAQVRLVGPEGKRQILLDELFSGKSDRPFTLKPGEILSHILVPKEKTIGGYEKLRLRRAVDYPLLGAALSRARGVYRLAVGAVGPRPYLFETDSLEKDQGEAMIEKARSAARPAPNTVVESGYRREMIPILARKLVERLSEEA